MTFEEVAQHAGIQACRRTLTKAFILEGNHRRKAAEKPFLTPMHITRRLSGQNITEIGSLYNGGACIGLMRPNSILVWPRSRSKYY
jgi:hypothetical protein